MSGHRLLFAFLRGQKCRQIKDTFLGGIYGHPRNFAVPACPHTRPWSPDEIFYLVGLFLRFCKIGLKLILGLVRSGLVISDRISDVSLSGSSDLEAKEDDPLNGVLRNLAAEG